MKPIPASFTHLATPCFKKKICQLNEHLHITFQDIFFSNLFNFARYSRSSLLVLHIKNGL